MKRLLAAAWVLVLANLALAAEPLQIKTINQTWHDSARNRDVPVRIYQPVLPAASQPVPVVILSHGLGGNRESYPYLGQYWASHGYFCVHLQHAGSDTPAIRAGGLQVMETMKKAVADPQNLVNRPKDVSFAIDHLEQLNAPGGEFAGMLDLTRIGVAGHSFGSYTTLAIAGQVFSLPGGREISFVDKRVKAAIAMSEQPPRLLNAEKAMARVQIPVLHMAGTEDRSPFGDLDPADRRRPYDLTPPNADQYLILFDGARHLTFAGVGVRLEQLAGRTDGDAAIHRAIQATTTLFWDAYLKDEPGALKGVRGDGLQKLVRPADHVESKLHLYQAAK